MKNPKLLAAATLAGLTLGALSITAAASAQSLDGDSADPVVDAGAGDIVLIQEPDELDAEPDTIEPETTEEETRRSGKEGCDDETDSEASADI